MKIKSITFFIALVVSSYGTFGQGFQFGPKLGANMGKIDGQQFSNQYALGYHAGVFAEVKLSKEWAIQPELLWNQFNMDTVSGFNALYQQDLRLSDLKLNYISIPLLLNYKPVKLLTLQAGPQFGILLDNNKNLLQNGANAFKQGDFSMLAGVQLNVLRLRIYGRYMVGLTDISDLPRQEQWRSQSIQLGVGIAL